MTQIKNQPFFKQWEESTDQLAHAFAKHYFDEDYLLWWVANQIGGTICINDHYFNLDRMVDYLRYQYTSQELFEHYDWELAEFTKGRIPPANIKNWRQLNKK